MTRFLFLMIFGSFNLSANPLSIELSGAQDPVTDISAQVLIEAYSRLGVPLTLDQYPSARSLAKANNGISDG